MANELNFESLLHQLGENVSTIIKGGYKFSELTMNEQRRILNMGFNPIEIPARISNLYTDFIKGAVELEDDIVDVSTVITIDVKPFVVSQLRQITLGNKYVENGVTYIMREILDSDLVSKIKPTIIEFNNFILRLCVPDLDKEQNVNNQLLLELKQYKKKLNDEDYAKVADLYHLYEIIKFITEIEFQGNTFDFESCPVNKKIKIINSLPQKAIAQINDYIDTVKESEIIASQATNEQTGESIEVDMTSMFFTKTAKEI